MKIAKGEVVFYRKYIEFVKLLNIYLNHFPKFEKYALTDKIRNTAYEIYDLTVEGGKRCYKKAILTKLDIMHEQLRMQLLLAYELGYFRFKDGREDDREPIILEGHRYSAISLLVDELGKMIGAWMKKVDKG